MMNKTELEDFFFDIDDCITGVEDSMKLILIHAGRISRDIEDLKVALNEAKKQTEAKP